MKFFNKTPSINAFDTENYSNNLKLICDAYGNYYEPDYSKPDLIPDKLLEYLFKYSCDLNFLYNIDYDVAILFHALKPDVAIDDNGIYFYKNYKISYLSNKSLIIRKYETKTRIKIIRFFDIAQFYKNEYGYQTLDKVAKDVLGIGKNNEELGINRELIGNELNYYEKHKEIIIKYCVNDAYITMLLSKKKILSIIPILDNQIPKIYNSSASISKSYLSLYHSNLKNIYYKTLNRLDNSDKAVRIIENSYYGGIFYLHTLGKINSVYEYDINSAYPYVMTQLYDLTDCSIEYVKDYVKSDYGFYHVKIKNLSNLPIHYRTNNTEITYIQNNDYVENYFTGLELEYFFTNHSKDIEIQVIDGVIINTKHKLEFTDFNDIYNKRNEIKKSMKELKQLEKLSGENLNSLDKDMSQWGYKTILNASYGCFAERKNGYTVLTNMIYASYITAMTRLTIYKIIDKVGWEHVKAVMTDAVLTDVEIKDKEFNNSEIGNFKLEGFFNTVWIYMNGIYVSKVNNTIRLHNRGFPSLTDVNILFNANGKKLKIVRDKKIIKIKEGIIQHKQNDIGKFTSQTKYINLDANRWKYLLDIDKLNFEYLKDNELITNYMYNIDLEYGLNDKPYLKKIDLKDFNNAMRHSYTWKETKTKTYNIEKIDYGLEIDKIVNNRNTKRNLKRFYNRYKNKLDADFVAIDKNSIEHKITDDDLDNGILRFNDVIVDMTAF